MNEFVPPDDTVHDDEGPLSDRLTRKQLLRWAAVHPQYGT